MFCLKTRDLYNKINFIYKNVLNFIIFIPLGIVAAIVNIIFLVKKSSEMILEFNVSILLISCIFMIVNLIFKTVFNLKMRQKMMWEFLEIVHKTKLPQKLPKVVYVYTTKNDFMEARLLQNLKQSYSNLEVWVSVGGQNDKNLDKIKQFVQKHNLKLHILKNESKSKADNLNDFLKNSGATFDYLLIGDADVAFDKNFTENALKLFYSDRALRLGYVSSTIFNYKGKSLFTNGAQHFENEINVLNYQMKNFKMNWSLNLLSACCLISQKMLSEFSNQFPDSNLEDWYLEKQANKNLWAGVITPLSVAMQSFEKNIWANLNRYSRLFTWGVKYYKTSFFKKYNVQYEQQNKHDFLNIYYGFIITIGLTFIVIFVTFFAINFKQLIFNLRIFIILCSLIVLAIVSAISFAVVSAKINKQDNPFYNAFLTPFYLIVLMISTYKNWFKSLFLSKYTSFDNPYKQSQSCSFKMIKPHLILAIVFFITLFTLDFLLIWFKTYEIHQGFIYLISFVNFFFFIMFFYEISLLVLHWAGNKVVDKNYSDNNFVYCENQFVTQAKVVEKFNHQYSNLANGGNQ